MVFETPPIRERGTPAPPPPPISPTIDADEERRLSLLREDCLRSLAKRYCWIFAGTSIPSFFVTVASEGEALPAVVPAFIVVSGLLAAVVSERSDPGKRLRSIDDYLKGVTPAPPTFRPSAEVRREEMARVAEKIDAAAAKAPAPPFPLRAFYFLIIGVWLSFAWVNLAWILALSIVGIGAARAMFEQLPVVMSLTPVRPAAPPSPREGRAPVPLAALYYVGVGSWLSLATAEIGWLLALFPPTRRAGLASLRAVPYVLTLRAR